MEKRALIAIALSFLIMLGWQAWFVPEPQPVGTAPMESGEQIPSEQQQPQPQVADPVEAEATTEIEPPAEAVGEAVERQLHYENNLFDITLSNRGGRVLSWRLKEYLSAKNEPVEMAACQLGDPPFSSPCPPIWTTVPWPPRSTALCSRWMKSRCLPRVTRLQVHGSGSPGPTGGVSRWRNR
jgi:hypothetical protein